jgi:hypothetical protein
MFSVKTNSSPILFRKNDKVLAFTAPPQKKSEKTVKIVPKFYQKGTFKREV